MGIQRKPRTGLLEVMESSTGDKVLESPVKPNSLLLQPPYLPNLILRITKEKGIKGVIK